MDRPTVYRIRVRGRLDPAWSAWFEDVDVVAAPDGVSTITGRLPDQAALHGLLARVRDLGLDLVSVESVEPDASPHPATEG